VHVLSSADVVRWLMLIAKRGKWQFVVKTCRYVCSVAVVRPLCWLANYLKSSVFFWTQVYYLKFKFNFDIFCVCVISCKLNSILPVLFYWRSSVVWTVTLCGATYTRQKLSIQLNVTVVITDSCYVYGTRHQERRAAKWTYVSRINNRLLYSVDTRWRHQVICVSPRIGPGQDPSFVWANGQSFRLASA
jgi:hypothetical protein